MDFGLTRIELHVATLAANGYGDKEIEQKLLVSFATIRSAWERIFLKTGSRNRTHAASMLVATGAIEVNGMIAKQASDV